MLGDLLDADRVETAQRVAQPGHARPHPIERHTWDLLLPHLGRDRQYVLVDGPGLGLSEPLRTATDIDTAAQAAVDLLDGLSITEPVDWVGNAFGGHVGFKLARDPRLLRSLVALSAPADPIDDDLRRRITLLRPLLRTLGAVGPLRTAILDALLTESSRADPQVLRIVLDGLRRPARASTAAALESFTLRRVDVNAEMADIAVPSLFLATDDRGDWSPEDAARAAARAPTARWETVPGLTDADPARAADRVRRACCGRSGTTSPRGSTRRDSSGRSFTAVRQQHDPSGHHQHGDVRRLPHQPLYPRPRHSGLPATRPSLGLPPGRLGRVAHFVIAPRGSAATDDASDTTMKRWRLPRRRYASRAVSPESPHELFGRLRGVASQAREPGDLRSESVLYESARRTPLERSADSLIAREEWHRLS